MFAFERPAGRSGWIAGIDDATLAQLQGDTLRGSAVVGWWFHQGDATKPRGRATVFGPTAIGSYAQRAQYDVSFTPAKVAAADVDGDGRDDLVLLGSRNEVMVMAQSRTLPGTFEAPRPLQ